MKNILVFLIFLFSSLFPISTINAAWYQYLNNPIIPKGPSGTWNSRAVHSPMILKDGPIYRMWYQGDNNVRAEIGYAFSIDGLSWTPHNTYILGYLDNYLNYNSHNPFIIKENNKYHMWFSGSNNGLTKIHINYTTSDDGIIWNQKIYYNVLSPEYEWENGNGISYPRVVLNNGVFHLWYGAHGYFNGVTRWKIGHATSTDGINWIKNNHPVLFADQIWENAPNSDVANPYVVFENGLYNMYYHSNGSFAHAISADGVFWQKDSSPFYTNQYLPNQFDSKGILDPFIIKIDNIDYLYYTGINQSDAWQIGLATSVPITPPPSITMTPTPTITSTPSPTPKKIPSVTPTAHNPSNTPTTTSTPPATLSPTMTLIQTPTPTPMINPEEPVIFLPGLGGSWGPKNLCDINASSDWKLAPYAFSYSRLLDTLQKSAGMKMGKNLFVYTYDWRQNLDFQADAFRDYFNRIISSMESGARIKLVGHSMGGLVIRSFLTKYPTDRVSSVLTIGSPHAGSLSAYPIWENAEMTGDDLILKIALHHLLSQCRMKFNLEGKNVNSKVEALRFLSPSVKDLLPVSDYLIRNGSFIPVKTMIEQNDWIGKNGFPENLFNVSFNTLSGNGKPTSSYFNVIFPKDNEVRKDEWIDGKPVSTEMTLDGDGTVLNSSSMVLNANNILIPGDHQEIMFSDYALKYIFDFLGLPVLQYGDTGSLNYQNALTIFIDQPSIITVTDPGGRVYSTDQWIQTIFGPEEGNYKIKIISNLNTPAYLRISGFSKNSDVVEKVTLVKLNRKVPLEFFFNYSSGSISDLSAK